MRYDLAEDAENSDEAVADDESATGSWQRSRGNCTVVTAAAETGEHTG
jgi:hypothetical protein